jgi:hypothetical protein
MFSTKEIFRDDTAVPAIVTTGGSGRASSTAFSTFSVWDLGATMETEVRVDVAVVSDSGRTSVWLEDHKRRVSGDGQYVERAAEEVDSSTVV